MLLFLRCSHCCCCCCFCCRFCYYCCCNHLMPFFEFWRAFINRSWLLLLMVLFYFSLLLRRPIQMNSQRWWFESSLSIYPIVFSKNEISIKTIILEQLTSGCDKWEMWKQSKQIDWESLMNIYLLLKSFVNNNNNFWVVKNLFRSRLLNFIIGLLLLVIRKSSKELETTIPTWHISKELH